MHVPIFVDGVGFAFVAGLPGRERGSEVQKGGLVQHGIGEDIGRAMRFGEWMLRGNGAWVETK
jgi:hypothetical protein